MIKILHVWGRFGTGGVESVMLNIFKHIDGARFINKLLLTDRDNKWEIALRALSVDTDYISGSGFVGLYKEYKKYFKKNKEYIDIVHIHYQHPKCFYIAKAAKKYGIKTIVHSHLQGDEIGIEYKICRLLVNRYADYRVACSRIAGNYMFGAKQKIVLIKNAIDLTRFGYNQEIRQKIRQDFGIDDQLVIGHVGRFCRQKNHQKLLEIFYAIKKKHSKTTLVMVGWGELENEIKQMTSQSAHKESIIYIEPTDDIENIYNIFDVFVFPSLYEGLPVACVEAQANGLRTFVSDTVSEEVKISDVLDFIPLNADSETWADIVLNSDTTRVDVSDQIRKNGYDMSTNVHMLERIYDEVCEHASKAN